MILAVTGGTGFVGQAVLDEAALRNIPVRALVRRDMAPRDGVEWVRGDLADQAALARLMQGADAVQHIAGAINAPDEAGFIAANVTGTENVLAAARAADVRRFVLVSSLSAREPGLSDYGRSKRLGEEVVQTGGLDWTIVRPPAIYGPRDREMLELFKAARWGIVPMPPPGHASIIHVSDLARLLLDLVPAREPVSSRIFEPDDGRPGGWPHAELARAIGRATGRRVRVPHLSPRFLRLVARLDGMIRRDRAKLTQDRVSYMVHPDWVGSPQRAVPASIWQPAIATPQGLRETAEWYRRKGWL